MSEMNPLRAQCYDLLQTVPEGRVTTYKALAEALGTRAYRAVGRWMNTNPDPGPTPCHRVVNSDGRLGGFAHGDARKIALLADEGVEVQNGRIVDFEEKFYNF